MSQFPLEAAIKPECDALRAELLKIELTLREMCRTLNQGGYADWSAGDRGEVKAQAMLAVRHVEDARMRIGKMLQHARDGVSVFDRPPEAPKCP